MLNPFQVRNSSDSESYKNEVMGITLEPGQSENVTLGQLARWDGLVELIQKGSLEVLRDGLSLSLEELTELLAPTHQRRANLRTRIMIHDVKIKLARAQTLFFQVDQESELPFIEEWCNRLNAQIGEIQALLERDPFLADLTEDLDNSIASVNNGVLELENHLLSRSRRSIVDKLLRKPNLREPFLEDTQRMIADIAARVGTIEIRLNEVPEDDEKKWLTERLGEVKKTLSNISITANAAEISQMRNILSTIDHRLPLSNQFFVMLSPIVGVITLQALIWWSALKIAESAEQYLGVAPEIFAGIVIAGTLGSLIRVIFRAIGMGYIQYRSYFALYLIGLVRPILGAVLALAILLLFNSTWVAIPLPTPDGSSILGDFSVKETFFLLAGFLAGFSDEWVLNLLKRN